jgi:hypothetical protein
VKNGSDKGEQDNTSQVSSLLLLIININYNTVNYLISVLMENSFIVLGK